MIKHSFRRTLAAALVAATLIGGGPSVAHADPTSDAKVLFEAGQRAYKVGNFKAAITAFEAAYKLDARPGLVFSIAQAHRRQYGVDNRPGHVAAAIKGYKDYLALVPEGGRRSEAAEALAALEPVGLQLEIEGRLQPLDDEGGTQLVVSSAVNGAQIEIDADGKPRALPVAVEVTPGPHTFKVTAAGYKDESRSVEVASGAVTAFDIPLSGIPAEVDVTGPSGARVEVDGQSQGELPLSAPLAVAAGPHVIRLSMAGYEEYSENIAVSRAGRASVKGDMPFPTQRMGSIGLLVAGGGLFAAGVITGSLALASHVAAASQRSDIDAGKVVCRGDTCQELDDYNTSVATRDAFATTTGVLLGAAVLAAAGGVVLYVFDSPRPARRDLLPSQTPADEQPNPDGPSLEISTNGTGLQMTLAF
ncbi:MAG: PEGA domain-containing protein [Polyangiaceae bacterium]